MTVTLKDTSSDRLPTERELPSLSDGEGLYLLVHPNGAKWWRHD